MAYYGKADIHEGAAGVGNTPPLKAFEDGSLGNTPPLTAYQDGSLGMTPPLTAYTDGVLGNTPPMKAFQDGSLGYPLFIDGKEVTQPMTIHHGPMGEYFSANGMGEYFSANAMGCVSCAMGATDSVALEKEYRRLSLCVSFPGSAKMGGPVPFGKNVQTKLQAAGISTDEYINGSLKSNPIAEQVNNEMVIYLETNNLLPPAKKDMAVVAATIASYCPSYNSTDYPETAKLIAAGTGIKAPEKSYTPYYIAGGVAVAAVAAFLLFKK